MSYDRLPQYNLQHPSGLALGCRTGLSDLGFGLSRRQYIVLPNTSVSFFSSTAFDAVAASANSRTPMPLNLPVSLSSIHFIFRILPASAKWALIASSSIAHAKFVQKTLFTSSFDGVGGASAFGASAGASAAAAAALASFLAFFAALRAALSSDGAAAAASASAALRFFSFFAALRAAFSSAGDRGGVASPPPAAAASLAALAAFLAFLAAFSSGVLEPMACGTSVDTSVPTAANNGYAWEARP